MVFYIASRRAVMEAFIGDNKFFLRTEITVKDSYPLPRIDDTLDALNGSQWFSILDLKVKIQPEDKEKTAFTTGQGLWQFMVLPFGLFRRTFQDLLNNIRKVSQRLQKANLKLSPKKCRFFRKEVSYLGHIISADGVKTDPEKTKAVVDWSRPETVHDLRSFLGLCTYYRRFVRNFSAIARTPHKLTEARSNFNWTEVCEKYFNCLKQDWEPEGQIARWIQRLQEYDFEIQHRKGTSHGNADALSRRPCKESCKYCTNAEKRLGMDTGISVKVLTTENPGLQVRSERHS
ncbi:Retrovirus-related Pol polyprotein from transposon gypsy [Araneus ventricosus]|uniref:RNA-directed DNA polymerase n=1 Tax=Araneus ventricosus TaxID=182803 RepID=A0A4Y2N6B2_ARAVE|nr:Retrovirus-related Pol polyprotein from transposon gypsy [Araneus ventricosus]